MVFPSSYISGQVQGQLSMFGGYQAYAQQLSYGAGLQGSGMQPPPPPPPPPNLFQTAMTAGVGGPTFGQFGEQAGVGAASFGRNIAAPVAMTGLQLAGGMGYLGSAGRLLDPFSAAMSAGRAGFAAGGIGGGALAAGAAALPYYAAYKAADIYGGAFMGGMQDQAGLNSTLRGSFQQFGGQGFMGRGFSQQQMGGIGQVVSQELRSNVFTSAPELNQLIAGGAGAGMFQGVRDVAEFSRKFKEMINTLKAVQSDLGGSLTEALQFVNQAKQSGIFSNMDRMKFASGVRETMATSGMSSDQVMQLTAQGAQISRAFGGAGRQGAFGALRGAQQMGSAMSSGIISESMLSEATGGLTGTEAIQAYTSSAMMHTGQFLRRPMGRFNLFNLSNDEGTGLDRGRAIQMMMGDTGVGEIRRGAFSNTHNMGRARSLNREGQLRGAFMEQYGTLGEVGMMRQMMGGDRVEGMNDDLASLVMQRRFHLSRSEADVRMTQMRNLPQLMQEQALDAAGSRRQASSQHDIEQNRTMDAFMRHLEHGMADATGVTKVRELGRDFMTGFSSAVERAANNMMGIATNNISRESEQAIRRMSLGRGRAEDFDITAGAAGAGGKVDYAARGLFQTGPSVMQALRQHGYSGGADSGSVQAEVMRENLARGGVVSGQARTQLVGMMGDTASTNADMMQAMAKASAAGDPGNYYQYLRGGRGVGRNGGLAADAYLALQGYNNPNGGVSEGMMLNAGGGDGGSALRGDLANIGVLMGKGGPGDRRSVSQVIQQMSRYHYGLQSFGEVTSRERAISFLGAGGHAGDAAREQERQGYGAGTMGWAARLASNMGITTANSRRAHLDVASLAVGSQAVTTALENPEIAASMRRIASLDGTHNPDGMQAEIARLNALGMASGSDAVRNAVNSMTTNMKANLSAHGRIGSEFAAAVRNPQEDAAQRRAMQRVAGDYTGLLVNLQASFGQHAPAGATRAIQDAITAASGGSGQALNSSAEALMTEITRSTGQDRANYMEALSRGEMGQALLAEITMREGQVRNLTGRGRRGQRGAEETALSMATGANFANLDIMTGPQGHQRRVRTASELISRLQSGSETERSEAARAFTQANQSAGVTQEHAMAITQALQQITSGGGEGGRRISETEAHHLQEVTRAADGDLDKIRTRQAQQQAAARDPVAQESLEQLRAIRTAIENSGKNGGDSADTGTGAGARGQGAA